MKAKDSLMATGMNYQDLGKSLVERAQEQEREQTQKLVVSGVQAILKDIAQQEGIIENAKDRIKKQKARIEALRTGKFELKYNRDILAPTVEFEDADLKGGL